MYELRGWVFGGGGVNGLIASKSNIALISNPKKEKILCYQTYSLLNNSMFYIKRILSGKF